MLSKNKIAEHLETEGWTKEIAGEKDFNYAVEMLTLFFNDEPTVVQPKLSLMITGRSGVGKSHLALAVMKLLRKRGEATRRINLGDPNHMIYFRPDYQDYYGIDLFAETVFLDDLGAEQPVYLGCVYTEVVIQFIWAHHARAIFKGGRLVVTSNYNGQKFDDRYGERVYSRLEEYFLFIPLSGEDKRPIIKARRLQRIGQGQERSRIRRL